ncbi:MAG TPA: NAD-dependent epimerase/dehydratase family protein [Kofleriaceae bacterium]|jgi:nucleoside-diphosphate-sugar epimerase
MSAQSLDDPSRVASISAAHRPWVIVGCGYTGTYLARALLARGTPLTITRRTADSSAAIAQQLRAEFPAATIDALVFNVESPDALDQYDAENSVVVVSAPPGRDPAREIRDLPRCHKLVYLSSTGVYGRGNGALVDESWPTEPLSATGIARLAAESALADRSEPTVALRIAGIHGPGRGIADRIKAGTYRIVGDGTAHVSRIHVEDLARAIIAAGDSDITGPINIADDDPAPIGVVADAIAQALGMPPPVRTPVEQVTPEVAAMLTADRRISNARMKSMGVTLAYPSWRSMLG